ncbi:amidophosphoribosyltransferase [Iodobacter ciconiae]|uniref:Amidophosphoribosyltransferase n=1 Tax=Iodobacter ciconiae TaxID=2496266 RepID=A0A3S8ZS41_9NEIS|nr:amidophosphoribosyltransferase [Iodobacter ciconiae]AZN36235.1 amidophosphoribosyltransferase [Iodobacter ciconiae]
MCGIVGIVAKTPVNQLLYDGLLVLQHRGQDAAGIVTAEGLTLHMHKGQGLVSDVFRTRNMRSLMGNAGIGHVRYPTAGSASSLAESQPFYVNSPFGIVLAHNGNLTNDKQLKEDMYRTDLRHINTNSDSEALLNVFAHELSRRVKGPQLNAETIFDAIAAVHDRVKGAYAVVAMIAGFGLVAFRDPYGIRPLCLGTHETPEGLEYIVASESVAHDVLGFKFERDIAPGEAVFVTFDGEFYSKQCHANPVLVPCIFEHVYFARPDSVIDGISVHEARLNMGENLADKVTAVIPRLDIDVVIPIPDTSRDSALQLANKLGLPYREGFMKNRYIGRTFIMPGQASRKKSVRQKLNPIAVEFRGKNVLLVDDSIVRGTTSRQIVQMVRDCGATKVYLASAAPPVMYPHVYGIDMPTRAELIATGRTDQQIADEIGVDAIIYQELDALIDACSKASGGAITSFETSCFDGKYITGDITLAYLDELEAKRLSPLSAKASDAAESHLLDMNIGVGEQNLL